MSGGVITIPNTHGAVTWAVPNANFTWSYGGVDSVYVYQITDVTQDMTNTYVTTNCVGSSTMCGVGGGLPVANGSLKIQTHPAPKFTCLNCTGLSTVTALNNATPGSPLFSYSKRTYDETWPIASTTSVEMWGKVNTLNYTVSNPFAGGGVLSFFPTSQFVYTTYKSDGTTFSYIPNVDLKTGGLRTVTPSGVTGGGGADANLSVPSAVWFTGSTAPNISAHPGGSETITVEFILDQGVVNPLPGG
jgi:hypothetical protein